MTRHEGRCGWTIHRQWQAYRVLLLVAGWLALSVLPPALALGQEPTGVQALAALEGALIDSIARAEPSVVAIARVRTSEEPSGFDLPGNEPAPLFPSEAETDPSHPGFIPHEFGAGVVIDAQGLIVTNYHVLGDIEKSTYWIWAGRKPYRATVMAADPWLDLAVLKTDATGLKPIRFGDGAKVRKGQIVIALGNPYAIARDGQPSATWGIVSNLSRLAPSPQTPHRGADSRETLHQYGTLIQTDARLENGTSGGALINLQGEMIGLTSSLAALAGYERPGGFAIPVDEVFRRSLETLKQGRMPEYGFLGVATRHLAIDQRQAGHSGASVVEVVPATPASRAGLQVGDVITQIDGQPVDDEVHLIRVLSGLPADRVVGLGIERGGPGRNARDVTAKVTLSKKRIGGSRPPYATAVDPAWRGVSIDYATALASFREHSRELDPEGCIGVLDVARDSAGWRAGLRPGDFISHVGSHHVATPRQFQQAVALAKGPVTLRLTGIGDDKTLRTVEAEASP